MKLVIISDIHDNLVNLKKCLSWCKENKINKIICCGDVTNNETLDVLSNQFDGEIFLVRGNAAIYKEADLVAYKNIKYFGRVGKIFVENKSIGFCHEPYLINKVLELGNCDIVFYGHTHKPWLSHGNDLGINKRVLCVNPGTLGGVSQKATFSFWEFDTGKLELKILEKI